MKKIAVIFFSLILCISLAACGAKSSLSSEERNVINKPYADLIVDEKVTFEKMIRKGNLTDEDIKNIKSYINQIQDEELKKTFLKTMDYEERQAKGQLTDKEKEEEKKQTEQTKEVAKEFNDRVKNYMEAEKTIQNNLNNLISNDKRFIDSTDSITVKEDSNDERIIVAVNIYGMYDLKVGEVAAIRNMMVDEVQKVIKPKEIEAQFKVDGKDLDTYIFTPGTGWNKEVKPKN